VLSKWLSKKAEAKTHFSQAGSNIVDATKLLIHISGEFKLIIIMF